MTVVYGTLFKDSIGTGREIRHIGVKPFFIDLLEFAALLQFFHSFVYLLQEFLVVLIEAKARYSGFVLLISMTSNLSFPSWVRK